MSYHLVVEQAKKQQQQVETIDLQEEQISLNDDSTTLAIPSVRKETIPFVCGNVEEVHGIIHLFKQLNNLPTTPTTTSEQQADDPSSSTTIVQLPQSRSPLLCVLAVPSYFTTSDFCEFISCFMSKITKIRLVRDDAPNRYMALLQFDHQKNADAFYLQFNGKPFTSMDPEECKLVFVSHIEMIPQPASVNLLLDSSNASPTVSGKQIAFMDDLHSPASSTTNSTYQSWKENKLMIELPTCPVCLERLDSEVSGIITTICNHKFHCDCLTKWGNGSSCPVCRFSLGTQSHCAMCATTEKLWVCLTCGHIGCSRFVSGHAVQHFHETNHTYAMEIESQRVWDYIGDGYVHRLIQSKTDGKVVELPHPDKKEDGDMMEAQFNSKLDAILLEYNQLLANQLSSQRVYYESQMCKIEKEKDMQLDNMLKELHSLRQERKKLASRIDKMQEKQKKDDDERKVLMELNTALIQNQKSFKESMETAQKNFEKKLQEKDTQIQELQEQNRDLLAHFEMGQHVQGTELQQGGVGVATSLLTGTPPKKQPKKSSKKK